VVLLPEEDGSAGAVTVTGAEGAVTVDRPGLAAALDGSTEEPFAVDDEEIERVFGRALAARPELPVSFHLYFFSDSIDLKPESTEFLPRVLAEVARRPAPEVSVIGHSDTFGDRTYNDQLALRRARHVRSVIVNAMRDRDQDLAEVTVTSHGERNPLVPTGDEVREPRNRRVQVTVR